MIRPDEEDHAAMIADRLRSFSDQRQRLLGIQDVKRLAVLTEQIVESERRVRYAKTITKNPLSENWIDENQDIFDPLRAAIVHFRNGDVDEAFWLVFLATLFGKHGRDGWRLAKAVYRRFGDGTIWSWRTVSADPEAFRDWWEQNQNVLLRTNNPYKFGNHRKYESLRIDAARSVPDAVSSYVNWVGHNVGHAELIAHAIEEVGDDPSSVFEHLYQTADVVTFGRTGKFDFLSMIGKLEFAQIESGRPYLSGATGPAKGARLLIWNDREARRATSDVESIVIALGESAAIRMDVLEDALCNWQKSPAKFVPFRG